MIRLNNRDITITKQERIQLNNKDSRNLLSEIRESAGEKPFFG